MAEEKKAAPAPKAGDARRCQIAKCKRPYRAKGYCVTHFKEWRRGKLPKAHYRRCKKEGCNKPMLRRGLCAEHGAKAATPAAT
jgi:hypothetical protein